MNKVVSIKTKGARCSVVLDSGEVFEWFTDIILKYKVSASMSLDDELLRSIVSENNLMQAKRDLYAYTSYSPRTRQQVIDKIKTKGYGEEVIDGVVAFLTEFGLLDDRKFAISYINTKLKTKSPSKLKLKMELIAKGISKNIAEEALSATYPHELSPEIVLKAAQKKYRMIQNKPKEKHKTMIINYLRGQGFDWSDISKALEELEIQ